MNKQILIINERKKLSKNNWKYFIISSANEII